MSNAREEFYVSVTPEQLERSGGDIFIGTRVDTGQEIRLRLLQPDELKKHKFNMINKPGTAYRRPEISDMFSGEGTGQKQNKVIDKFKLLNTEQFKAMPNVVVSDKLYLRVDTAMLMGDGTVGARWITILNGEGPSMVEMDVDRFIHANGVNGNGLYINMVRPSKHRVPSNLFIEALNTNGTIKSSLATLRNDLASAMNNNQAIKGVGGSPLLHVLCFNKSSQPQVFNFSYVAAGKTKTHSSSDLIVRSSYSKNNEWHDFDSGEAAADYALSSNDGKTVLRYLENNPNAVVAIVPAGSFIIGPNIKNKIINNMGNERMTNLRYASFEVDCGGEWPLRGYNKGQFAIRQGTKKKESYYVTDICTTNVFNKAISLADVAAFKIGLVGSFADSIAMDKPVKKQDG